MNIPLVYELPLIVFIILAIYTIYRLYLAKKPLGKGSLAQPYNWFIAATVFLMLWAVDHMYHDLVPLSEELQTFFHYILSHGLLLIAMVCLTVSADKTKKALNS